MRGILIKLAVFDFDGVFTDNKVYISACGESARCHRGDGIGLEKLKASGIHILIITQEPDGIADKRCAKLGISCITGSDNKYKNLHQYISKLGILLKETAYMGNDINDLECMKAVGVPCCPADAVPEVKCIAKIITSRVGGDGCVRELCENILVLNSHIYVYQKE